MRVITAELLRDKGACGAQVQRFEALFPEGVVPTLELCLKHSEYFKSYWGWAITNLTTASVKGLAEKRRVSLVRAIADAMPGYTGSRDDVTAVTNAMVGMDEQWNTQVLSPLFDEYLMAEPREFFISWEEDNEITRI